MFKYKIGLKNLGMPSVTYAPTECRTDEVSGIVERLGKEFDIQITVNGDQHYGRGNIGKTQIEIAANTKVGFGTYMIQLRLIGPVSPDLERRATTAFGRYKTVVPLGLLMPSLFGDGYV